MRVDRNHQQSGHADCQSTSTRRFEHRIKCGQPTPPGVRAELVRQVQAHLPFHFFQLNRKEFKKIHVTGTSSILAVAALIIVAATSIEAVAFHCPGINYNIRAGAGWAVAEDKCKPASQIASELKILKSYTNVLRLYSLTDCDQAVAVVPAAIQAGFQLELGLWVDSYNTSYTTEREAFATLLNTGVVTPDNIVGVHVGSEAIYRGDVTYDTALGHLREIRKMCLDNGDAADIPLTITDVGNTYLEYPSLIDKVDYVSANLFPFWDRVVPAKAAAYFLSTYQRLVDLAATYDGNKSVVIGETGWATNGSDTRASEATPENSVEYFHDFYLQAQEQNITYYYFSAFDEAWKGTDTVEAYFGLFYANGEMKPIIAELELDDETSVASTTGSSTKEEVIATVTTSSEPDSVPVADASSAASEETEVETEEIALDTGDEIVIGEPTVTSDADTDAESSASSDVDETRPDELDNNDEDDEEENSAIISSVKKDCAMV